MAEDLIEFLVDDVDREYERLTPLVDQWVQKPTTMPWGNRSILFRDPDGALVNLFTPVTDDAIKKFGAHQAVSGQPTRPPPGPTTSPSPARSTARLACRWSFGH